MSDTAPSNSTPRLPRIVIVGRPNVGKSSLLNMLANRRISIVDSMAGVTRDRVSTIVEFPPSNRDGATGYAELIDTGGHGIEDIQGLTDDIERQIATGLDSADLILFVLDAQTGITPLDETVGRLIRRYQGSKPVIVVSNKVDSSKQEPDGYEGANFGFGEPVLVSAQTKFNKFELYDRIRNTIELADASAAPLKDGAPLSAPASANDNYDESDAEEYARNPLIDEGIRIAIVGKRNAGKSSLVNAICGEYRVIVSDQEGTTRDSIDVRFELPPPPPAPPPRKLDNDNTTDGETNVNDESESPQRFTIIDTAGVRKRKSMKEDIEYYATHRALRSVRRADVCLLVIDATLPISQVDHQLVAEIVKHHRPVIIVVNKWDLVDEDMIKAPRKAEQRGMDAEERYVSYLDEELRSISFAPVVFTSAVDREGLDEVLAMATNLHAQASHRVGTGELNSIVEEIIAERAPRARSGKQARIFYATQTETNPPTLVFQVNTIDVFDNNYQLFMMNRLRDSLPYSEVPIRMLFRGKEKRGKGGKGGRK